VQKFVLSRTAFEVPAVSSLRVNHQTIASTVGDREAVSMFG